MPLASTQPHSKLASFFIKRHYAELGCDDWDTRRVQLLCAKLGDTPAVLAARLRVTASEFERRMVNDRWSDQDGLILTIIEREVDFIKGAVPPKTLLMATSFTES